MSLFDATRCACQRTMSLWLVCITLFPAGCLQLTANNPRFLPRRLPDITFHVRIPGPNLNERLNISATGQIYAQSSDRGIATGMLSDDQVAELQKAFTGWEQLPPTYPSQPNGPIYIIAYAGHAVTGGSLTSAPQLFLQATGELRQIMDTLPWKKSK